MFVPIKEIDRPSPAARAASRNGNHAPGGLRNRLAQPPPDATAWSRAATQINAESNFPATNINRKT